MKVLLVSFSELPTLQRYLYLLAHELGTGDCDVYTVGSNSVGISVELSERNALLPTPNSPKPSLSSLLSISESVNELVRSFVQINPDIVHFVNKHTWNYILLRKLRKAIPQAKFVHTFHDPIGHEGDSVQKGVILYHKAIERMLDGVIVHSDIAYRQTIELLRPKCSVFQSPLGVTAWREYDSSFPSDKEVLIFGRLNTYKGVEHYPQILDALERLDPEIHVTIAGKASKDIEGVILDRIAASPNCTLRNEFVLESDIDSLFSHARIVLVPYTSITQSGVILDAYSRSRAVVCFDIPGIDQYVPDEWCRVPAFEYDILAEKINFLTGDNYLNESKNCEAWRYGKEHFTPAAMARAISQAYEKI